ncbi:MAG: hypothetical protein NVS1B7_4690 [Candidatus Saccharimonadales bacterium]
MTSSLSSSTTAERHHDMALKSSSTNLWQHVKIFSVIVGCIATAIAVSKYFLLPNSIRLDEAQSLWQTSHSLTGTLKVVAQDVHVPLYHLILHFVQTFFGQNIVQARTISLFFFILTIPIVYLLARAVLNCNWSLLVVILFSFSPFLNWYANEARMYTMLVFITSLSQYYFIKIIKSNGKRGWLGYSLSALFGIFTHYFFIFNLAAQAIYFILNHKKFEPGTLKRLVVIAGGLMLALLPWLIYFFSLGAARNTSPHLPRPSSVDLFNVFSQFGFGFQSNHINTIIVSTWPIFVIVALLAVKRGQRLNNQLSYLLFAGLFPILLAFVLSYAVAPFFLSRYMVACIAPLTIVVVWFISNYRPVLSRLVTCALLFGLAIIISQQYINPNIPVKEDYRAAASVIGRKARAEDNIVITAPFTVYPFDYYYNGAARVYTLPEWDRTIPGPIPTFNADALSTQITQLNAAHQYTYLLLSFNQGYENQIYQYYEQHFQRVDSKQFSSDLRMVVYRVNYNAPPPLGQSYARL